MENYEKEIQFRLVKAKGLLVKGVLCSNMSELHPERTVRLKDTDHMGSVTTVRVLP